MNNRQQWITWLTALLVVGLLMHAVLPELDKAHITLGFLLVVLGGSSAGGRRLGISLAIIAFIAFDWFFLPPYRTLVVANPLDWLVLGAFLVTGLVAAQLLELRRRETRSAVARADEIDRLATLGAETLNAPRAEDALDAIASVIRDALSVDQCEIYAREEDGALKIASRTAGREQERNEYLLAYVAEHAQSAVERGDGTISLIGDVIANSRSGTPEIVKVRALVVALRVRTRLAGALRLSSADPFTLDRDQRRVLSALAYYAALGAERVRLARAEEEGEGLRRADLLKDALLAAVSHDLRTPLTAIKGVAHEIWNGGDPGHALLIEEEADRLTALVQDLLELSQLNAGGVRANVAVNTVDDVIVTALEQVEAAHGKGRIDVVQENDGSILAGRFDLSHTTRIVVNLLENAFKYSPADTLITVRVTLRPQHILIAVEDLGPGVPVDERDRIFDPFVRGSRIPDGIRGTGLGLAIARQLAEMQHGSLRYEQRDGRGSRFIVELRAAEPASL